MPDAPCPAPCPTTLVHRRQRRRTPAMPCVPPNPEARPRWSMSFLVPAEALNGNRHPLRRQAAHTATAGLLVHDEALGVGAHRLPRQRGQRCEVTCRRRPTHALLNAHAQARCDGARLTGVPHRPEHAHPRASGANGHQVVQIVCWVGTSRPHRPSPTVSHQCQPMRRGRASGRQRAPETVRRPARAHPPLVCVASEQRGRQGGGDTCPWCYLAQHRQRETVVALGDATPTRGSPSACASSVSSPSRRTNESPPKPHPRATNQHPAANLASPARERRPIAGTQPVGRTTGRRSIGAVPPFRQERQQARRPRRRPSPEVLQEAIEARQGLPLTLRPPGQVLECPPFSPWRF